jgi:hypothetical protein
MLTHCPKCNSLATVPILYGKPDDKAMEAAKYGLVVLAGCVIDDERINRHCKVCYCEFTSHHPDGNLFGSNKPITVWALNERFNELEKQLTLVHQSIERDYMEQGRDFKGSCHTRVIEYLRDYQEHWAMFMHWLKCHGDPTIITDDNGSIRAKYSYGIASLYLIKHSHCLYQSLQDLANASHWLGRTSRGDHNDIDDLKNASVALQNARIRVREHLQGIRSAATSYIE